MFPCEVDASLGGDDVAVQARELARLVECKSTACPFIVMPRPTECIENHALFILQLRVIFVDEVYC